VGIGGLPAMRNDLEILEKIDFETMIFDEIQSAKNKTSLTNAALTRLNGKVKIGLTGTPIENDLFELKALFDIILPGYLGNDRNFKKKYFEPIEQRENQERLEQLHRVINPFILRRSKSQVLEELPPKTEEVRKCELSPDQVKLYKDVLNSRVPLLIQQLNDEKEKIPYMHIFAVLNYLKQICNHPAQLEDNETNYQKYRSGKWDLFCELLQESLNSGFKVVVFSQYLNMLALIEAYLKDIDVQFATIKGSTKKRGEMIERFNNDPDCMVFTGSLKASGLGITLVGGSVVIHYDRWWNAAREDQATDRVHRIGQTRGVQVFKLITENTLEEKIDKIISKKKKLMESLVKVDDASIVKKFDRDELIDLLSF
jgi:SNF2 family DNA or RNA helicase